MEFGIWVALLTPFDRHGDVDGDRLARHAGEMLARGAQGVTLFGTTGEGASVGTRGRSTGINALRAAGISCERITLGLAATAVEEAAAQARQGLAAGITRFLVPPPFFFRDVSDDGLFGWYSALAGATGEEARFILYHIPQLTQIPLSLALLRALADALGARICAVKDSSGDWQHTRALLDWGALPVLVGDERQLHRALALGAAGSISGMANLHPERLLRLFETGEEDRALSAQVERIVSMPVVPALKFLLARECADPEWERVRPPLSPLDDAARQRLLATSREGKIG